MGDCLGILSAIGREGDRQADRQRDWGGRRVYGFREETDKKLLLETMLAGCKLFANWPFIFMKSLLLMIW